MRGGKFLAEETPEYLLRKYHCDTLEETFLKLSVLQNLGKRRRSSIIQEVSEQVAVPAISVSDETIFVSKESVRKKIFFSPLKNPVIDISDEDHGEISGEFGDSTSMSTRVKDVITGSEAPHPPLPPEEELPATLKDYLSIFKPRHLKALIWKNFLWMWRNVG